MSTDRTGPRRRPLAGLLFVGACALGAAGCGDFQLAEFTKATTTTIEVEAAPTTLIETAADTITSTTFRPLRYTVEPGDSLGSIAGELGVSVPALMQANGITDPDQLRAGQELVVPDPDAPVVPPWQQRQAEEAEGTEGEG